MSRSKKNWDELIDFYGNYAEVDRDVGVARVIGGDGIQVNPPRGVGTVVVSVDPTEVLQKGDAISDLDNDAGYLTEVDHLNDIGDVSAPLPRDGQVLTWNGTEWQAKTMGLPDSFQFRGKIDCSTQNPEADPKNGWCYFQSTGTDVTPLPSWVGIETETCSEKDGIIYLATGEWEIIPGVFDVAGFQDLNAQNSPTPLPSSPQGFLEYIPSTASFKYYPPAFAEIPDLTDPTEQPGTLDDRYVNKTGDTMTGGLTMSGQNIEDAGDLRLEGSLYLNGANTAGNDHIRSIITEGGVMDFGMRDSAIDTPVIGASLRRHTNDKVYLHLAEEPVLPTQAVTLSFMMNTLGDLEDDLDEKYVLVDGDTMKGTLVFDNVAEAIQFDGDTKVNTQGSKSLTFSMGGGDRLVLRQSEVVVKNKPFRVQNTDNSYSFTVSPGSDVTDGFARYEGKIDGDDSLVNKKYVDDGDETLSTAIDELDEKVDNLELGIPEADADAKYLHDIKVVDTIEAPAGTPADVTVANKNELTFTIPAGPAGSSGAKGNAGQKGDRGPNGADGTDGVKGDDGKKGEIGEKGAPASKGEKGAPGSDGGKGQKGAKGDGASGSFVTRGNKGSNIRIYYSGSKYYIAGTS